MIRTVVRRVRSRLQWLTTRMSRGPVILLYHRVKAGETDGNRMCVSPEHFREHLEVLIKYYRIVSLRQLINESNQGKAPRNTIALTFDDGYRCNWDVAYPLLESFGIPATFFITTGQIDSKRDYWWDELERLLLQQSLLPEHLILHVGFQTHEWQSGGNWDIPIPTRNSALRKTTLTSRRVQLFRDLLNLLMALPEPERLNLQDQLLSWAGSQIEPQTPVLSQEQVALLAKTRLIEIGAHSVSHPMLTQLKFEQQVSEMRQSRNWLESVTGTPAMSFAYPYGYFNNESVQAARAVGFNVACTCETGHIDRRTNSLLMPRLEIGDVGGEQFGKALRWLLARPQ